MIVRVLIVIVLVAVLGFFGTRGSEKVVEEVTERQEVVDDLVKQRKAQDERIKALEEQLARVAAERAGDLDLSARTVADLQRRVTELERKERERAESPLGQPAVELVMPQGRTVRIDGVLRAHGPRLGADALRIEPGEHLLEIESGGRSQRYRLFVTEGIAKSKLLAAGTRLSASGGATVTPLP